MISSLIEFVLGYFLWKYVPGMISHCPKLLRTILEVLGIVLMIMGGVSLVKSLFRVLSF